MECFDLSQQQNMIPKDPCTLDQKAKLDWEEAGRGQEKVSKWPCGLPALPRWLSGLRLLHWSPFSSKSFMGICEFL